MKYCNACMTICIYSVCNAKRIARNMEPVNKRLSNSEEISPFPGVHSRPVSCMRTCTRTPLKPTPTYLNLGDFPRNVTEYNPPADAIFPVLKVKPTRLSFEDDSDDMMGVSKGGAPEGRQNKHPEKNWRPIEEQVFTFQPKISEQSRRLVQSLESNFLSRQIKHLERQRYYVHVRIYIVFMCSLL